MPGVTEGFMADIRKREGEKGNTWQLRFNDPNSGEPRYKTFKRRKDADAFLTKLPQSDYVHDSDTITVMQASDRWLDVCEKLWSIDLDREDYAAPARDDGALPAVTEAEWLEEWHAFEPPDARP